MAISPEQVQQWIKDWMVGLDPEVEVQVLPAHDNPREPGEVIPVRLARRGYRMTVTFPEDSFPRTPLPDATGRTLEQVIRLLRYMERRRLPRLGEARRDG